MIVELEELYRLEEKGRKLATYYRDRSDELAYREISKWSEEIGDAVDKLVNPPGREVLEVLEPDISGPLIEFIDEVYSSSHWIAESGKRCSKEGKKIGECELLNVGKRSIERMDDLFRKSIGKKYDGTRCTWLFGVKEPYTLSAAINDVTSCFHRVIDLLAKYEFEQVSDKTYYSKDAGVEARVFCKVWEDAAKTLHENELYYDWDWNQISCYALKDRVELRVGSAAGHKTHIDLKNGKVRYYDRDMIVNEVMKKLLEDQGLKCKIEKEEEPGVECEGLTRDNLGRVAKVIAAATSMDLRIGRIFEIPRGKDLFEYNHAWRWAYDREIRRANAQKQLGNMREYEIHKKKAEKIKECIRNAPENPEFYPNYGADVEYCAIKVKLDLK